MSGTDGMDNTNHTDKPALPLQPRKRPVEPRKRVARPLKRVARSAQPRERRALPLLAIVLALVGISVAANLIARAKPGSGLLRTQNNPSAALAGAMPASVPPVAASSSWYCPGGGGTSGSAEGTPANESVILVNTAAHAARGVVTAVSSAGRAKSSLVLLPALGTETLDPAHMVPGPYVAASFSFATGGVTATEEVSSPAGTTSTSCASSTSNRWYFSDGSTAHGNQMLIGLYNPLGTDAVVNLTFATETGPSAPPHFQSIVIEARSLVVRDVGAFVQSRTQVATTVTALTGSVVADELQLRSGAPHPYMAICLGSPLATSRWYFPVTVDGPGMTVGFHIFNPGTTASDVKVIVTLTRGSAEPFTISIPPTSQVIITASSEVRIPAGVAYSTKVSVLSGSAVVAQRSLLATKPGGYSGFNVETGSPGTARTWLLAAEPLTFLTAELIGIEATQSPAGSSSTPRVPSASPGQPATSVSVYQLVNGSWKPLRSLTNITLAGRVPLAVRMNSYPRWYEGPLLVVASGPVVASQELYQVGNPSMSASIGIPLLGSPPSATAARYRR